MKIGSITSAASFIPTVFRDNRITQIATQSMRLLPQVSGKTLGIGIATIFVFSVFIIARYFVGSSKREIIPSEDSFTEYNPQIIDALRRLPKWQHGKTILLLLAHTNCSTMFFEEDDGAFVQLYSSFKNNENGIVDNSLILIVFKDKEAEDYFGTSSIGTGFKGVLKAQRKFENLYDQYHSSLFCYQLSAADYSWMETTGFCPLHMYLLFLGLKKPDSLRETN